MAQLAPVTYMRRTPTVNKRELPLAAPPSAETRTKLPRSIILDIATASIMDAIWEQNKQGILDAVRVAAASRWLLRHIFELVHRHHDMVSDIFSTKPHADFITVFRAPDGNMIDVKYGEAELKFDPLKLPLSVEDPALKMKIEFNRRILLGSWAVKKRLKTLKRLLRGSGDVKRVLDPEIYWRPKDGHQLVDCSLPIVKGVQYYRYANQEDLTPVPGPLSWITRQGPMKMRTNTSTRSGRSSTEV